LHRRRGRRSAIALGLIEPTARPLDADAVLAALEGHAARGTRIITAGPTSTRS
jgi:hypothetical protein